MTSHFPLRTFALGALISATVITTPASANRWEFRPSIGVDQRFDDNFSLVPILEDRIASTRVIGDLGLARETATTSIEGILRADLRLEFGDDEDTVPVFNGLALLDLERRFKRASTNLDLRLTQDTPGNDTVTDVTDRRNVAVDTGLVVDSFDVERLRFDAIPSFRYELSRRSTILGQVSYSTVQHETPSPADAIFAQYSLLLTNVDAEGNTPTPESNPELFDENGDPFNRDNVSIDQTGVFTPTGELDDFQDIGIQLGYRYQCNRRTNISATVSFSVFEANEEVDPSALTFDDLIPDSDEVQIVRAPRRDTEDTTARLVFGLERELSQTLLLGFQAGVFNNTSDDTELFRLPDGSLSTAEPTEFDDTGFLASISLEKDAGLTKYSARFAVDVQSSSAGSRVETNEFTAQVLRTLSPRLDVSLRGQAFEPDRLGAAEDDRFARRFISIEPRVIWRFARDWNLGASYRYRRQRAAVDDTSSESNAFLISVRYTPPSRIRDFRDNI